MYYNTDSENFRTALHSHGKNQTPFFCEKTPVAFRKMFFHKQDQFLKRDKRESVPYPWSGLNKKLYGLRQGELLTLTKWV